jgi:SAM-dependent methyltransferase
LQSIILAQNEAFLKHDGADMTTQAQQQPAGQLAPWRLGTILFLLSFATVVFTIVLFRLFTFFIMPSLFFDLLFIGFPLGALAGVYFYTVSKQSFLKTLWILQAAMLFSILAMLACKHFDYLRAHLFDVELQRLFYQMLIFTLFFLPFFIAYGMSEYIGYQMGRRALRGRMPVVYAIYLFGAAGAYLFAEFAFPLLGATRLLGVPLLLVALAMLMLGPAVRTRRTLVVLQAVIVVLLLLPQLESGFLKLYKGTSPQSTHAYANMGFETIHQEWGKYSLIEIMQAPGRQAYIGFYNDIIQWKFAPPTGFFAHSIGMLPLELATAGGRIAIIGAGAGRQVQYARKSTHDFAEIVAIEIEPAVIDAVRGPLAGRFDSVYEDSRVQLVVHEARSYMENTDKTFDLIYLPSVGGYPQMMLEPGNMIRTIEAYKTLSEHLTERGVLAIWYPAVLDPRTILTEQYIHTLESPEIGLQVHAFRNAGEFLILAARQAEYLPTLDEAREFYARPAVARFGEAMAHMIVDPVVNVEKTWGNSQYRPIRDNQPFLAGNVQHIFSLQQVGKLFALVLGLLLGFTGLLYLLLRNRGDPAIPDRSFTQLIIVSLIVGANFLIMEHYLILVLFNKLYVYRDALVLGAISFLLITGMGSTFIKPALRPLFQVMGGLFILLLLLFQNSLSPLANLALITPVAFVTGSFFPALFEAAAENPLGVFAADSIGAALGSMASFFIPIVFGFDWFFVFATVIFWATACATFLFFRHLQPATVN